MDSSLQFHSPLAFLLCCTLPILLYLRTKSKPATIRFPLLSSITDCSRSLRQYCSFLPSLLRMVALVLLALSIARPQKGWDQMEEIKNVNAIMMVLDRSGSMGAMMDFEGQKVNRLETLKRLVTEFIIGDGKELDGRRSDLLGIVAYTRFADTVCPLTTAHEVMPGFIDSIRLVTPMEGLENGTAIGDAIALASARLHTVEDTLARLSPQNNTNITIKSKVMILMTDGQNNSGKRSPMQAAKLATEWGIKIYTVGIGGKHPIVEQAIPPTVYQPFGRLASMAEPVNEAELKAIANTTGGQFFMAEDAAALKTIYREIDRLERTEIYTLQNRNYLELFPRFLCWVLIILGFEQIFTTFIFAKIP